MSSNQLLVPIAAGEVLLTNTNVRGLLMVGMYALTTSSRSVKLSGQHVEPRRVPAQQRGNGGVHMKAAPCWECLPLSQHAAGTAVALLSEVPEGCA